MYIYIYLFIYLFIGLSGSTVKSTIIYGVNLFTMPGMQRVVYAKSSKVLAATSCCLLLIKLWMRRLFTIYSLKRFSINIAIE